MGLFKKKIINGNWEAWKGKLFEFDFADGTFELVDICMVGKDKWLVVKPLSETVQYNVQLSNIIWWREIVIMPK